MVDQTKASFVGVDWGTSSFRLWVMAADGTPLAASRGDEGMLHCNVHGFQPVLDKHLRNAGANDDLPVLICGMAGARQGWIEAPYAPTPTHLSELHERAIAVPAEGRDIRILPGIAQVSADAPNVMRGEETQLLGSIADGFSGLVCMPGTHCKWVSIDDGDVTGFATFMTGELFSVISKHSILVHALEAGGAPAADDPAFRAAVASVRDDGAAAFASLFAIRAGQLLGFESREQGAAHLSGLLIGAEIAAAKSLFGVPGKIVLVGSGALGKLYETVLADAGYAVDVADAEESVRNGLAKAAARLWTRK
ncbi:2-dehydro-3-deoxygalactonokinase [Aquamicrobium sp. LC103]|uniref:2-dehydro-3-deoxygalactonokinase n=1 Tax=Aquamicrobium sp. LC103 TaxID=1120658 RepID=UPI00069C39B6|nr:2-dehydro-3-deoxygalactonokinase [Aquamicrobium sp. LC103]TKT82415.1 2-dehydro-3-deoxygalactonokinase [Aquamicrobium sp. LC103]